MAYKLAIPEHTEHQIDKCISYIVNTLRNPFAAEAVLDDIEYAYDLLEKMAESFAFCEDPYLQSKEYRKLALEKHDYVFIYRVNGETFIRRGEREYIFKYSAKYLFCAILRLIFDILILHCRFVLRTRGQAVIMRYEVQAGCIMAFARRFHKNTGSIITFIRLAQMSYLTL